MTLNPYLFYLGHPEDSGCTVVFARTARRARTVGFNNWPGHRDDEAFLAARAVRLSPEYHAFAEADGEHVVEHYAGPYETWSAALAAMDENGHDWHERFGKTCCRRCGIVRRADGTANRCRGFVTVRTRAL